MTLLTRVFLKRARPPLASSPPSVTRPAPASRTTAASVFQDPRYSAAWGDERAFRRSYWTPGLKLLGIRYRRPYNMRHSYATAILMAGMTPAFCARQLGHSIEMFLRTYARWIDGEQNDLEMRRLEASLANRPLEPRGKTVESALEVPQNGVSEQKTQ